MSWDDDGLPIAGPNDARTEDTAMIDLSGGDCADANLLHADTLSPAPTPPPPPPPLLAFAVPPAPPSPTSATPATAAPSPSAPVSSQPQPAPAAVLISQLMERQRLAAPVGFAGNHILDDQAIA